MHIAGIVLHVKPLLQDSVVTALGTLPGVELHAFGDDGRMVLTVEGSSRQQISDCLFQLNNLPGVINAGLVYEHSEPSESEITT